MAPGTTLCVRGRGREAARAFVLPSGAGQWPGVGAELGDENREGLAADSRNLFANRLSAIGAGVAGPRRTEITLKLRRVGSRKCGGRVCGAGGLRAPAAELLFVRRLGSRPIAGRQPLIRNDADRAACCAVVILAETPKGWWAATGQHGWSWAGRGDCELRRRRTSYHRWSLVTVVGPGRRAHAIEGEEIESEAATRRGAPHGYPAAVEPRRPRIPRGLAALARVLRQRLARPGVFSTLTSLIRLGLFCFQTLRCSRPVHPTAGTRRVSPCFLKRPWCGVSADSAPC